MAADEERDGAAHSSRSFQYWSALSPCQSDLSAHLTKFWASSACFFCNSFRCLRPRQCEGSAT
eukprot:5275754-Lingulodinium_polyedra.AAC.1